ncbi:hypothetical protein JBL43_02360 [Aureibaculum sp. A20]|uniref:Uncharacterized protein n=1 Tax=Aureibaculum flavum TaxID=2795986 RepID=A0ABS0WM60_9FLAO|nr:hypothetical protein [Aureibaculum flavum]MBJ2173063.1 hypothetical protein [Aureibaculum flavum]
MKKLKSEFTINEIGKLQFYSGILVGIGYSIILNYLFRFTLKVANFGVFINEWKWDYEINTYYYYLIGFTSVGFAFCYTIYI